MIMKRCDILDAEKSCSAVTDSPPPASGGREVRSCKQPIDDGTQSTVQTLDDPKQIAFPIEVPIRRIDPQSDLGKRLTLERFQAECMNEEHGGLVSPGGAAMFLGVSRQAVHNLMERGKIKRHDFGELGVYVALNEVRDRLLGPRDKGGRPRKA
jgi:hypothetical protein